MAATLIIIRLALRVALLKLSFSWVFFLLVLIFLGGVIIIIRYMASLAANEKFFLLPHNLLWGFLLLPLIFFFDVGASRKLRSSYLPAGGFYEQRMATRLTFCFLILLIALIRAVKLIKLEIGPLVKRL